VHEAVAARLVELEEAMNAELSQLAAAGQAQLAALQRSLGDSMGGIAQLKAQFEAQLNAAWEEYGENYAQLASVQEVRGRCFIQHELLVLRDLFGLAGGRPLRSWPACRKSGCVGCSNMQLPVSQVLLHYCYNFDELVRVQRTWELLALCRS
jgi:hypothetical protein